MEMLALEDSVNFTTNLALNCTSVISILAENIVGSHTSQWAIGIK